MAIDKTTLPDRPLLDTSVLIRALGDRPGDPEAPACQELVEALSDRGASILIAAPSVAEITRKRGAALPRGEWH
jgi:predicted nucleic acid-binding protein